MALHPETLSPVRGGISSRAVLNYLDAVAASGLEHHSIVIMKDGIRVFSAGFGTHTTTEPHVMHSVSKSFLSMAAGFAIQEGLISLNSRVIDILNEAAPDKPDPWLQQVTLHHLLSMSSGLRQKSDNLAHIFHRDSDSTEDWAKSTLQFGCDAEPGSCFRYNSHGSYLIACMLHKATGENLVDYLTPRLFTPLGIARPRWDVSPQGICCGGWGLYLSCEDMARFGQCLLDHGIRDGQQILPRAYIDQATAAQIGTANRTPAPTTEWAQGYCYHFWRCTNGRFRADGSNGQYIIVDPGLHLVAAVTADIENMAAELELLNCHIFCRQSLSLPSCEDDRIELEKRVLQLAE